jgi:hypothetical protein
MEYSIREGWQALFQETVIFSMILEQVKWLLPPIASAADNA